MSINKNEDSSSIARLIITFIAFLISCQKVTAQQIFEGRILSSETKQPVPYATVTLKKLSRIVNTNDSGYFRFKLESPMEDDSLVISSVGFESRNYLCSNFPTDNIFFLNVKPGLLQPVLLNSSRFLNETKIEKIKASNFGWGGGPDAELAQRLSAPFPNCKLSRLKLIVSPMSKKKDRIFQVKFYDVDSNGLPGKLIFDQPITIHTGSKSKLDVDLDDYEIILPEGPFFIAFVWLAIPENMEEREYFDYATKRQQNHTLYHPFFDVKEIPFYGFLQKRSTELFMGYSGGKWSPLPPRKNQRLNISVSYKY